MPLACPPKPLRAANSSQCDPASLEDHVVRYGVCDSFLILSGGRRLFWSQDRRGVLGFVRVGKYVKVLGGLIAPLDAKEALLGEFVEYTRRRNLSMTFYNITDEDAPFFAQFGFQITKWGEEPVVDLARQTWTGKPYEWVRRQSSFCRRHGIVCQECRPESLGDAEWDQLLSEFRSISDELTATRPQKSDLRFLQGDVDPDRRGGQRIFIARADQGLGTIEGYLVANPGADGDIWTFETYRHRPDAVRGTVAFLMHQAMQTLQREGVGSVSLCLVPGIGCDRPMPNDCAFARWALVIGTRYFGCLFDAAGMYHFKSRFRPRFENRYICAFPKVTLGSSWALVRLSGVLDLDFGKLWRNVWRRVCRSVSQIHRLPELPSRRQVLRHPSPQMEPEGILPV